MSKKITVAMSGGVDSSVAALLLKQKGYDVEGIFMRTWHNNDENQPLSDCPWRKDAEDAESIAKNLGINFKIINMIDFYKKYVVKPLIEGYRNGSTPNPDILCNKFIKFGMLSEIVKKNGNQFISTGHYCRKRKNSDGTVDIIDAIDTNKDQTYFLSYLNQEQIKFAKFPIGEFSKSEIRDLAKKNSLVTAEKKDSQGICFLGKVKIQKFLSHFIKNNPGNIVDVKNNIIGKHLGLHNFTIGQRHGINIPSNSDNNFYVVIGKNFEKNELQVAFEGDRKLYGKIYKVYNLNYTNKKIPDKCNILCCPRYRDKRQKIIFERTGETTGIIEFFSEQRALASGQIAAFYDADTLLGGGTYI